MRFYPEVSSQRLGTLARDVAVLALLALFAWLGLEVRESVDELAVLGEGVREAGTAVEGGFRRAGEAVDGIPVVGGDLAEGLRDAGEGTGGNAADVGREGEERIHRTANLLGLVTFLVPSVLVLAAALPPRVAQVRRLTAAERVLREVGAGERRRLLAMRAAFSLPYGTLLEYTPDPFGDLAAEDYDPLVAAALEDAGLRPRRGS
ncbi:MAG: hypothetical protein M3123_06170 [Actinomycetota bacterium]|nr:hypothetical protein [Actinomycetota bacterium]